ncbi:MAG: 4-(cytidine 5'-diphospho)-2-C-methyl-D-erythritol kinase [Butyrivibrio sp.]|nr:4-(cytidine 5'-diphospho)-2-C-methyl-D-erythritol kinase [Muribaculum sp.]MCM1552632.1 4-(cytidine 5'-diphospho)-2-C-methyl-D-erythritol kinase [Butyrivibrio sp.]
MNTCVRKAYAKINLGLDVLGILPNGYHEVKMVMQTVDIWDELTFERTASGITIATNSEELPTNGDNLIYKAAALMIDELGIKGGVNIDLRKNIPIAAGMAGGSADAAAAMRGICELYGLQVEDKRLMELGVRIGADVPYCIMGGTALAEGIGERLTELPSPPDCWLVIAKPDINVSTKYVYERMDAVGAYTHPDIDGMITALKEGSLGGIVQRLGNVLERVTVEEYPIVDYIKNQLRASGALGALMSGSGPTVFGIFREREQADTAALQIERQSLARQVFVTKLVNGAGESGGRRYAG